MSMETFQKFLDTVTDAVFRGDFETYAQQTMLPLTVITAKSTKIIHDDADLRKMFDMLHLNFGADSGPRIIRLATSLSRLEPNLNMGIYETHIFHGEHRSAEPFLSSVVLRDVGGHWKACMITNRVARENWQDNLPPSGPPTTIALQ